MQDLLPENIGLYLNDTAKFYLKDTAKWAKFLAILGFVFCGLMIVVGLGMSLFMSTVSEFQDSTNPFGSMGASIGFIYVVFAAVYFFPSLYLFQFAKNARKAIDYEDSEALALAIDKHHSMYKFMGIMAAILIGFYVIIIVLSVIGVGLFSAFN